MTTPKIAIVGAGPSGLTLANILIRNNINVTVYERETSSTARLQGGSLDLHPTTGQAAVKQAGLWNQWLKHARYEDQDQTLADKNDVVHAQRMDQEVGRPEIDRTQLRNMLLEGLPEGVVEWGYNLRHAEIDSTTGNGTLHFEHGSESGFDLLVGADGAWSKLRPLVTLFIPFYSSISVYELWLNDTPTQHPEISDHLGKGSYFVFGETDGRVLLCQRQSDKSLRVYAAMQKPVDWIEKQPRDDKQIRSMLLEEYKDWAPSLQDIIRETDKFVPRSLFMMPPGARWKSVNGVALLGDAAHLMTPFAGEGVNTAMTDSMDLASEIIKTPQDLNSAVARYEASMFPRAAAVTSKTWNSLLERFNEGAIASFLKRI